MTGAAGALGSATVRVFLDDHWDVIAVDREAAVDQPDHDRPRARQVVIDLGGEDAEAAVTAAIGDRPLHHVVAIAGGALRGEPETQDDPLMLDPELFRASVDANLTTQFVTARATLAALRRAAEVDRSITFTSSFNALSAQGMPGYSAAKAGLVGMMHALVDPLGRDGIRVNVVAPGTVRTPRTEALWGSVPGHFDRLERGTALGRLGSPEDIARTNLAVATLLTHTTGQVIVADGGQTVVHR